MPYKNPARPGATEAGECPAEKNPVWAREAGQCHGEKNPVWARVWAREKSVLCALLEAQDFSLISFLLLGETLGLHMKDISWVARCQDALPSGPGSGRTKRDGWPSG